MLVLLGLNHRSAPVEVRERLAFTEEELDRELRKLAGHAAVHEAFILSTCNRVEILVRAEGPSAGLDAVRGFLAEHAAVTHEELDRYGYHYLGRDAVRHLFEVAGGLDSMILGEPQITGQVKRAYRAAQQAGTTGTVLEGLLRQALATTKRLRTETGISRHPVSVASAAVELAERIFGKLSGRTALLLGAGKMAALVATHLRAHGVGRVVVSSRTYNRAETLARRFDGHAANWDRSREHLERVDIVISGTGAMNQILGKDDVQRALRARRGKPLLLIDIAVPRDIDPAVNELDNAYLYDVDDLQGVVDNNMEARNQAAAAARELVTVGVDSFERWHQSLAVAPTIVSMREAVLELGRREVERFRRRLGPLTPDQDAAVQELTRAVLQKILHRPIRHLKAAAERGDLVSTTRLMQELFVPDGRGGRGGPGRGDSGDAGRRRGRGEADGSRPTADGERPAGDDDREGRGPFRALRGGKES